MARSAPLRVFAFAIGLTALSFALGVAGDLSLAPQAAAPQQTSGARVVLRIPPAAQASPIEAPPAKRRPQARSLRPILPGTATAAAAAPEMPDQTLIFQLAMQAELAHSAPSSEAHGVTVA